VEWFLGTDATTTTIARWELDRVAMMLPQLKYRGVRRVDTLALGGGYWVVPSFHDHGVNFHCQVLLCYNFHMLATTSHIHIPTSWVLRPSDEYVWRYVFVERTLSRSLLAIQKLNCLHVLHIKHIPAIKKILTNGGKMTEWQN
jgi:hypothetical protein